MTQPTPSSDPAVGLFVTIDGPSGVGKTTTITHLARIFETQRQSARLTREPSNGPIGKLARELTDTVSGAALACLYAADRYQHLETEIRPEVDAGRLVLCDRYVPSALVMQRLDGVDFRFLWNLNSLTDWPHLAVVLTAEPDVISARLACRGPHNRLQRATGSSSVESSLYDEAIAELLHNNRPVLRIDTSHLEPGAVAMQIYQAIIDVRI